MTDVVARVAAGELVVIDGGTGTEIQRRGGAMDDATWCAEANLERPDLVREVHLVYLEAGAELVIANTFATSPLLFATIGRDDEVATIDRAAVRLAREARMARRAWVARRAAPWPARSPRCNRCSPATTARTARAGGRRPRCGSATGARRARWPRPVSTSWSWR